MVKAVAPLSTRNHLIMKRMISQGQAGHTTTRGGETRKVVWTTNTHLNIILCDLWHVKEKVEQTITGKEENYEVATSPSKNEISYFDIATTQDFLTMLEKMC